MIMPNLHIGGAEKNLCFIINNLDINNFIVKLILLSKEGELLKFIIPDIEIIDLGINRIRYSIFKIFNFINLLKPDIVFCNYSELNILIAPFIIFYNIKFIARETNIVSKHVNNKFIRFLYIFYSNFDKIIVQSNDMQNDLKNNLKIRDNKIIKINNPAFIFKHTKLSKPVCFFKNKKNILSIGNLHFRKGYDYAIKIFEYLKYYNIHLFIIGDGPERKKLFDLCDVLKLNNITFLGFIKHPYSYIKYADLFLLPSRYEGFPNVVLEAGFFGIPSLCNNCKGGINEIIINNINGYISNICDVGIFSNVLINMLNKKFNKKIIKSIILNKFNYNTIINKYNNLFNNI